MDGEARYLSTDHVALRARHPADVAILQTGLYEDLVTRSRADTRPWRPIPPDPALSPYAVATANEDVAFFSVVASADNDLAGEALLWGIDTHNRSAHLGLALLPAFRGRGWSVDVIELLCRYGFSVRGLNRLQLETLSDNTPMIRAAEHAGFQSEGVRRESAWVLGSFVGNVVMSILQTEWRDAGRAR